MPVPSIGAQTYSCIIKPVFMFSPPLNPCFRYPNLHSTGLRSLQEQQQQRRDVRGGEGGGDGVRSSFGSHSPIHLRKSSGSDYARRDSGGGGGGSGGMVPAEAESAPAGTEFAPAPAVSTGTGGGGGGGGKKRSKKRRGGGGGGSRSSSSRRERITGSDGGMRPAMPDDGPVVDVDEMRPSPGDGSGAPGPWGP